MSVMDWATVACCLGGAFFFSAGTMGLLRFPDLYCRLHALTKADNLGLGLVVLGLLFQTESVAAGLKLLMIWGLALLAGSSACYLLGRYVLEHGANKAPVTCEEDRGEDGGNGA